METKNNKKNKQNNIKMSDVSTQTYEEDFKMKSCEAIKTLTRISKIKPKQINNNKITIKIEENPVVYL